MIFRAILIWLCIAAAETLHGVLRVRFANRRLGDRRARQLGIISGSAIILVITWLALPWIGIHTPRQAVATGALWTLLMLAFDVAFGRFVFRASWQRILADFDLRKGGFLGLGMAVLLLAPLAVGHLRGLF
jgi:hypothetical protein